MNRNYYCPTFKVAMNQWYVKPITNPSGQFRILTYNNAKHEKQIKAARTVDPATWLDPNKSSDTFVRLYDNPKAGDIIYLLNDEHIAGGTAATLIGPYIWLEHTTTCRIVGAKVTDKYGLYPLHPSHVSSDRNGISSVKEGRHTVMFKLKNK